MLRAGALHASVLAAVLPALAGGVLSPARADPEAPAAAAPTSSPSSGSPGDATDPNRPVRIEVSRMEPRALTPDSTITVSGTLTNTGNQPITDLTVRLQRGRVITTRSDLSAAVREPDPANAVAAVFQPVPGRLGSGDSLGFAYTVSAADLEISQEGVYPALLNINGTVGGDARQRVGQLSTFLVEQPSSPTARATVGWLWPLAEPTHRGPSGGFTDDALAQEVAAGGRLDRALSVIERLPRPAPPAGAAAAPSVPVTLAVDPALVEELGIMAAGPYSVGGQAGKGTEAARAFLSRLRTVAGAYEVVALPYGDVDAESLVPVGLGDVVARGLPGQGNGTGGTGTGGTGSPGGNGGGTSGASAAAAARILNGALGVQPRTDLAWSPGGTLHVETLNALRAGGIDQVVVPAAALDEGQSALGLAGRRAATRTTISLPTGPLPALVGDSVLGDLAGATASAPGGGRLAEQRYIAELAVLALQSPGDPSWGQTLLVAPPREVDADPGTVAAMMSDTAGLPWLHPASVNQLSASPAATSGTLLPPAASTGLDAAGLADVAAAVAVRNDLAAAVVERSDLDPYDAAIARTVSVAWRGHPRQFRDAAAALRSELQQVRGRVTLLAPASGTYSLASGDAPVVLTVRNDLPFPVRARLQLKTRGNVGLTIGDLGLQELAPRSRTTLQVPAHVNQSGRFVVTASLTTPDGGALGDRVQFQVRSTAYGTVSLVITFGAGALLGLLFLRRLARFLIRRRRNRRGGDGGPDATAAGTLSPPVRSPV